MRPLLFVTAITAMFAFAADRPELNGTWQLSTAHEGKLKFDTLQIQQSSDSIKITESNPKEKVDLSCGVEAQECKLKDGQISFWYNGAALVMMEMHHNKEVVIKTRLVPDTDGKTLSLELTRVEPAGPTATYTFKKQM